MTTTLQQQSAPGGMLSAYEACVKEGKLHNDEAQRLVARQLEALVGQMKQGAASTGLLGKLLRQQKPAAPRSIYIWGEVGRGKSLLMDMFFAHAPEKHKRRIHFHAFMAEVHAAAHEHRQQNPGAQETPVSHVAREMAGRYKLFCLDELQVTDVADAMILSRLFTRMIEEGVTFVVTSNRPPEDLYLGGLQREKFLTFVDLVYERMHVVELTTPHDYRMLQLRALQSVYITPRSEEADLALRRIFNNLTHNSPAIPALLEVLGRRLQIAETYGGVAMLSFHEICEKPLGAADYLAIAQRFHTVIMCGVPRLNADKRNEAKRFVTFIDTLYDHRVKFICTAEAPPESLYEEGHGAFEFRRTVSRLTEMQSESYLASAHMVQHAAAP